MYKGGTVRINKEDNAVLLVVETRSTSHNYNSHNSKFFFLDLTSSSLCGADTVAVTGLSNQ
jgi:hypothetical protein